LLLSDFKFVTFRYNLSTSLSHQPPCDGPCIDSLKPRVYFKLPRHRKVAAFLKEEDKRGLIRDRARMH
jgi:hypothetical protein